MLNFLNLKSKAIHLFFLGSIQPQHTVVYLVSTEIWELPLLGAVHKVL